MAAQGPATPSALYKMISIPEAQQLVLKETECLPSVPRPLSEAQGCILAEDVHAPEDVPPFPASIKVQCQYSLLHKLLPQLDLEPSCWLLAVNLAHLQTSCCW